MKKGCQLTMVLFLFLNVSFGQNNDSTFINVRSKATTYYIDGFVVYNDILSKADSAKILKDMVSKLNGCWTSEGKVHSFNLSEKTYSGTWHTKGIHSTAPLVRLELLNGQLKLIVTDVIGGDGNPRNIRADEKTVTIEYSDKNDTFSYTRLKKCP